MIKITKSIRNNKALCNIIEQMNKNDKGFRHYDCRLNLSRCSKNKRYINLLETANKLDTFNWEKLIMNSDIRDNVIEQYDVNIKWFVHNTKRYGLCDVELDRLDTFHKYVTNYYNSYKTFFRNG